MDYAHSTKSEYSSYLGTLAVDGLVKGHIQQMMQAHATQLMMRVGLSVCQKPDVFNKKTGRELAGSRLIPLPFELRYVQISETKHHYIFRGSVVLKGKPFTINFTASTVAESDQVNVFDLVIF